MLQLKVCEKAFQENDLFVRISKQEREREREKEKQRKNAHIRKKEELLGQKMFIVVNQKLGDWKGVKYGETKINRVLIYFFL